MSENTKLAVVSLFLVVYLPFMFWVAFNPQWP